MVNRFVDGWIAGLGVWVAMAILVLPADAQDAVVTTKDGGVFTGQVVAEDDTSITLLYSGIKIPIPRVDIAQIQYKQTIEQQYTQRRAQLADDDLDGRYTLAYWLFNQKAYELAKQELVDLGKQFPDDTRVQQLRTIVQARIALRQSASTTTPTTHPDATPQLARDTQPASIQPQQHDHRLSQEEINLIKVYEIDLSEEPKVYIPAQVMDDVLRQYAHHPSMPQTASQQAKIRRDLGYKQLAFLFKLKARDAYPQIKVVDDPPAMREFRTKIHQRYVLNYCGTVLCHGGAQAPNPAMLRLKPNQTNTVYTNFLTLQLAAVDQHETVDRQDPDRSLLLQYGMARPIANPPHPEVPGWKPRFPTREDRLYQEIRQWIDMLWKPTPEYGIAPSNAKPPQPSASQPNNP